MLLRRSSILIPLDHVHAHSQPKTKSNLETNPVKDVSIDSTAKIGIKES